jgi:hypothetical protein
MGVIVSLRHRDRRTAYAQRRHGAVGLVGALAMAAISEPKKAIQAWWSLFRVGAAFRPDGGIRDKVKSAHTLRTSWIMVAREIT